MITNTYESPVQSMRPGDIVRAGLPTLGIVASIDRKVKWVVVTYESGHRTRALVDATVTYDRNEKDEAEIAIDRYEFSMMRLRRDFEDGFVDKAVDQVRTALARHEDSGYDMFTYSNLDDILIAQARFNAYRRIDHVRSSLEERGLDADTALAAAYKSVLDEDRNGYPQNPLNRSTSVLSNLLEDVKKYVVADIRKDLRWYVTESFLSDADAKATAFIDSLDN